jgi:hypothetical protein
VRHRYRMLSTLKTSTITTNRRGSSPKIGANAPAIADITPRLISLMGPHAQIMASPRRDVAHDCCSSVCDLTQQPPYG